MEIRSLDDPQISHILLSGRLDIEGVGAVEVKFLALTAARRKPAVVDISQVSFIGSLGIGMLVGAAKALAHHGAKMVLLAPQPLVERTLMLANIPAAIPVAQDLATARNIVG